MKHFTVELLHYFNKQLSKDRKRMRSLTFLQ